MSLFFYLSPFIPQSSFFRGKGIYQIELQDLSSPLYLILSRSPKFLPSFRPELTVKMQTGHAQMVEDTAAVDAPPASSEDTVGHVTVIETIKQNPKVIFYSVLVAVGPMMYGFDNIIVGIITAMPAFKYVQRVGSSERVPLTVLHTDTYTDFLISLQGRLRCLLPWFLHHPFSLAGSMECHGTDRCHGRVRCQWPLGGSFRP